jgi:hypothetical protein
LKWPRIFFVVALVVLGSVCWLIAFNMPFLMFSQLGFCESAAELGKPEPDCPAPLWHWVGCLIVPMSLTFAGVRKGRAIMKECK